MNKLLKSITLLAAAASVATAQTTTIVEQWDFTDNSLIGVNGTATTFFDSASSAVQNADQTGGAFDNTYTVNRSSGFSGNVFSDNPLNISVDNTDTVTLQFTLAAWDVSNSPGSDSSFNIRLRNASNQNVMQIQVRGWQDPNDSQTYLRLQGNYYNNSGGGQFIQGGWVGGLTGSASITVGLTFNLVNETYTFWFGDPATDDGSGWVNRLNSYTGDAPGIGSQTITQLGWGLSPFEGNGDMTGDFLELDQVIFSTTYTGGGGDGFWGGFPIGEGGYVDTGDWIGWVWVDQDPWVWSFDLDKYVYVPQASANAGKGWVYAP
ncbi:hypothetical protein G0Q06_12045 [Puniceicoccales bacterium CK1056]|uniref:PEP-CTERM sorting domain-containing protein n=1 Tax=Oceanipulchritudo coccoides TaxID=2706888 RepID=A0A6B2M517_9BACT|nr:hypothetical protein [Oceanipulchritudo coccoides]NDV63187.1 hypothetical protein [Oceanipulchritudo coccoides]